VSIKDACDPTTFNAVVGPGTCVRPGGVQFDDFIAELKRKGEDGAWHFAPSTTTAPLGQTLVAINRGGEVHTFTHVKAFGGGIVPLLNDLAHVPNVAPECLHLEGDDFVAPGTTYEEDIEDTGTQRFQCCIHPWMRLEVRVPNR
jgi:plastocyanin